MPDDLDPQSVLAKTFGNPVLDATKSWDIDWRRAEIPAAGGHGNARSVAQIHTPMACGGEANGVRFLGKETIDAVFDEQCNGTDLVLGVPVRHGIGFGLPIPRMPLSPNERTCFWGGWGGSLAIVDLDARMSFSYVMNKMGEGTVGDTRGAGLLAAAYMCARRSAAQPAAGRSGQRRDQGADAVRFLGAHVAVAGELELRDDRDHRDRRRAAAAVDEPIDEPAPHERRRAAGSSADAVHRRRARR